MFLKKLKEVGLGVVATWFVYVATYPSHLMTKGSVSAHNFTLGALSFLAVMGLGLLCAPFFKERPQDRTFTGWALLGLLAFFSIWLGVWPEMEDY
jgi:hypothetical protein